MMNDTVREELQSKITTCSTPRIESTIDAQRMNRPLPPRPAMILPPAPKRQETGALVAPKTSPTLVAFQSNSASLPDWRLQLQNAVQQRKGTQNGAAPSSSAHQSFPTNGSSALKAEIVPPVEPVPVAKISDPRVANAMRRINESRQTFLKPDSAQKKMHAAKPGQMRVYPFDVVSPNSSAATGVAPARVATSVNTPPKPKLVIPPPIIEKRDTNKLPPIAEPVEQFVEIIEPVAEKTEIISIPPEFADIKRIRIRAENAEIENADQMDVYDAEIEDLAPFSMRFGAGLFDLIIAAFAAILLLSPFAFYGASVFTSSGLLTFTGAWAIVTFLYMTICVGFLGKTMGMRLFSLELVDAGENEYPTLHQAAINSSLFLLSLGFGGAGFLTAFFNEERRAVHDLLSGTIIVREF